MNFRDRLYKPALLALAAVLFCVVGQTQSRLNVDRKEMGLTKMDPLENAPPVLAFTTVALGGFRGLIANALWMRLSSMQEDDKYFEMVQLGDWITKLQPHMVQVWIFQGWNMAYNISVKFKNHEDRWRWVQRGIELMRDNGLKWNPNETKIYREISWIYQHKIGANLDDAHMLYKLRLAQEMQCVTGDRPDFAELENPTTPEWKERARLVREKYKMDPKVMESVDKDYGPFDWRLPDAYAVYWAELGRIYARPEDQETLRRSIYQSLQQMIFRGGALDKSVTNVTTNNFILWPNLDQVPVVSEAYVKMIAEETNNPKGFQKNMETAHKNFLKQAIYLLYEDGRESDAQKWFAYLKSIYPESFVGKEANMNVDEYALSQIKTDIGETDQNKVEAFIKSMFDHEFVLLLTDNDSHAADYNNMARRVWKFYTGKTGQASGVRVGLKPLSELQQFVFDQFMANPRLSPGEKQYLRTKLNLPAPAETPPVSPTTSTNTSGS